MPKVLDQSMHDILSKPEFYTKEQREEYVQKRIIDEVLEDSVPSLPTRQKELDYLEELENEFRSDRWLQARWRKLQAGPWRRPYKITKELKDSQKILYGLNFMAGSLLAVPLAIFVGRRFRVNSAGVGKIYYARNIHRFPRINPNRHGAFYFYIGFGGTCFVGGSFFAHHFTRNLMKDEYYTRPDYKPSAPMVEDTEDIKKAKREFYKAEYGYEENPHYKKTVLYRLFRPNQADYSLHYEDRTRTDHPGNTYNQAVGGFPSATRMYEHHWK